MRGKGLGSLLYRAAEQWARSRGDGKTVRQLKAETQDINVGACRFYAAQGAVLGAINCYGYSSSPYADETMLLWYKDLV
jgi:GNAT superfamily N-acetyltransferase